jgi:hypothetical protein
MRMLKTSHCLKFLEALESTAPRRPFKAIIVFQSIQVHTGIVQVGLHKHTH